MDQPRHILIVDDEPANRDLLEAMVEALGHVPELACDGPTLSPKFAQASIWCCSTS